MSEKSDSQMDLNIVTSYGSVFCAMDIYVLWYIPNGRIINAKRLRKPGVNTLRIFLVPPNIMVLSFCQGKKEGFYLRWK